MENVKDFVINKPHMGQPKIFGIIFFLVWGNLEKIRADI